ncbi:MAG: glycosyltransferase family A protein [Cyanobacteria bacterium J06623_4]
MPPKNPPISVVIATRDRGASVVDTVDSILETADVASGKNGANAALVFEILVIDQSANEVCMQAMQKYTCDPRVRYQHSSTVGMARARNIAIAQTHSNIIAITDDDCTVAEDWLISIQNAFLTHSNLAILFGNVLPAEHDGSAGFIPSYCRQQPRTVSGPLSKNDVDGLGACMSLRKDVWREFYGFDEMLGVGGKLKSSSEGDLVIRALHRGYEVCETPTVRVVHHGFRTWAEGERLIARYWYGTGAMFGKHLKLHPVSTVFILGLLGWRWAFGKSRVADSLGPNMRKRERLMAFISGLGAGLWLKVNRKTGHFQTEQPDKQTWFKRIQQSVIKRC